jgi:hypothetical protein
MLKKLITEFMSLFRKSKKIHCRYYYNQTTKELDRPKLSADLSIVDSKGSGKLDLGNLKTDTKITIPEGISEELVKLDQLQYNLGELINSLKNIDEQERQKIEYIDLLKKLLLFDPSIKEKLSSSFAPDDSSQIKKSNIKYVNLKKYLEDRTFKSSYLPDDLSKDAGYIIWPVALQPSVTYIHKAQIQLIKLFVKSGWKLHVIIGDCGKHSSRNSDYFIQSIKKVLHFEQINIENNTIALLSEYYKREENIINDKLIKGVSSTNLLSTFHAISDKMIWSNFSKLIKKNYDEDKQKEIDSRTVLNNIQPLLTWSLAVTIVTKNEEKMPKAIVLAGEDEFDQWNNIADDYRKDMGVIYIHELKKEEEKTMVQEDLQIRDKNEMLEKLGLGNMAEWLFTHFVELPNYFKMERPNFCKIAGSECEKYNNNCLKCLFGDDKNFDDKNFNKTEFVDAIYPIANPANL